MSFYFSFQYFYLVYYPSGTVVTLSSESSVTDKDIAFKHDSYIDSNSDYDLFDFNGINYKPDSDESGKSNTKIDTKIDVADKKKIVAIIKEFIDKNPEYIRNAIKDWTW